MTLSPTQSPIEAVATVETAEVETLDPLAADGPTTDPVQSTAAGLHRLEFVDGMRALAALFVLFSHICLKPSEGVYHWAWLSRLSIGALYFNIPVDVFIVLSGFCLMLPVARRNDSIGSVAEWYKRRARRILPPYYGALVYSSIIFVVIAVLVSKSAGGVRSHFPLLTFGRDVFLVQDFNWHPTQNLLDPPFWSIAVECQIYLLMIPILIGLKRIGNLPTALLTAAVGIALFEFVPHEILGETSPWYVCLFTMGAIAAREGVHRRVTSRWRLAAYLVGGVTLAVMLATDIAFFRAHIAYFAIAIGLATSLFLGATMHALAMGQHSPMTRILSWRPLVAVGIYSYSLYLTHFPLLQLTDVIVRHVLRHRSHNSPEWLFLALVALTPLYIGVAYLFHLVLEKPFMGGKRRPAARPAETARGAATPGASQVVLSAGQQPRVASVPAEPGA
jgi:peptidoglycan/LPS O-acetylase OafA/YrhL